MTDVPDRYDLLKDKIRTYLEIEKLIDELDLELTRLFTDHTISMVYNDMTPDEYDMFLNTLTEMLLPLEKE